MKQLLKGLQKGRCSCLPMSETKSFRVYNLTTETQIFMSLYVVAVILHLGGSVRLLQMSHECWQIAPALS